ncbi:Fumarylacetoacetase-like protein [Tirmania nivea]|nr:Fumarylacetoacetase-like protein [Tirmania nivea]
MASFSRLIRFIAADNKMYYGDAILPHGITNAAYATKAKLIEGDIFSSSARVSEQKVLDVKKLLAPIDSRDVRTVRCLGLNYAAHARESSMPIPKFPILFYKPVTSLSGPTDPIPIPAMAQDPVEGIDYECELVIVIGKPGRDIPESKALDYVFGYSVGNDMSHREWQIKKGGGQWSLGKGFDGWAPFGPAVVSPKLISNPNNLRIMTKVNGKTVQDSTTADQIFGVAKTISFLSQGTTLLPGDIIFTGTPQGVAMGLKPPVWLKDGDVVEVILENVGSCVNEVVFEPKDNAKL